MLLLFNPYFPSSSKVDTIYLTVQALPCCSHCEYYETGSKCLYVNEELLETASMMFVTRTMQ